MDIRKIQSAHLILRWSFKIMNIKQVGMIGLGIAIALIAIPTLSNSFNASQSVQRYANIARVDQNNATVSMGNHQTLEAEDSEEIDQAEETIQSGRSQEPTMIASSYSVQESSVSLGASELKAPYVLRIRPRGGATYLQGTVKLNGRTLKSFNKNVTEINLSPYLRKGYQKVQIIGSYRPSHASVEIAFEGPSTEMTQETGGNGIVNQMIVVEVQDD